MKTKIHYYQFSGSKDPAYKAMCVARSKARNARLRAAAKAGVA